MADESNNNNNNYDVDVSQSIIDVQQHQEGDDPVAVAARYGEPVIHAADHEADVDVPVIHDPHAADADVTAQAAQAIAASASAYNIPTTDIIADAAYAGYAVDQTHGAHAAYANASAAHHINNTAASHPQHATGMEYMAMAASTAAPGPELLATVARTTMHGFAGAVVQAQQQPQPVAQPTIRQIRLGHSSSGRQAMDILLKEQKQALIDLNLAEAELSRAEQSLAKAKQNKLSIDKRVSDNAESLTAELLEEKSRWNEMYQRLVEYKRDNGHCHVMRNPKRNKSVRRKQTSTEKNLQSLGTWVGQVRLDARRPADHTDRLEPYKIVALDRLGFDWEPRENYWMDMYDQLKLYLEKSGGKMPPRFIHNQKFALGQWCDTQLDNYRKFNAGKKGAYITQEKIDMLNQVGFIWDKRGQLWKENYKRLKEFKAQHGHCHATSSNNGGDKSFGTWVTKQKRKYGAWKRGEIKSLELCLTDEQGALMDEIEFGDSVEVDGRKLRKPSTAKRPQKTIKYSLLNKTIAGLVNASEEIEGRSEGLDENVLHQRAEPPSSCNDEQVMDENYNNMAAAVTNGWADSANAVSLLVDAIMNKEGRADSSGPVNGTKTIALASVDEKNA